MQSLEQLRKTINEIDKQMAALFEQRMKTAASVAAYKKEKGLPVLDSAREKEVVNSNLKNLQDESFASYYTDFLQQMMRLSREYQTQILGLGTAAYQGGEGGFGQMVATRLFPHGQTIAFATFADVFEAVESGKTAFGIVPFENSNTGDVSGILDLCYAHNCYVCQMYDLPVTQNLLGLAGASLADVHKVISHPQALQQSKRFLDSLQVQQIPYENTALAAKHVAEMQDKSLAAIASLEAAEKYGLVPLAQDISTEADNTTRFIIITKQMPVAGNRFSLLVTVENAVGKLAGIIQAVSALGFDMENIKSRPMPRRPWEYYFYIELVGQASTKKAKELLESIREVCLSVRILGIYEK